MWTSVSLGYILRSRIARSYSNSVQQFEELADCFPKKLHHFTFLPAMCHPAEWRCQLNLSRTAGRDGTHRKHHKGGPRCCIPAPHFTCLWQSTWHAGEHGVSFQIFYPPHLYSSGKSEFVCMTSGFSGHFILAFSVNYGLMSYLLLIGISFIFYFIIIIATII